MNLLGNLPLKCLDVLLTLEPLEGSLEFLGANMDVIRVLLSFLEKRLQQVGREPCWVGSPVAPAQAFLSSRGHCFTPYALVSRDRPSRVRPAILGCSVVWPGPSSLSSTWSSPTHSKLSVVLVTRKQVFSLAKYL